MFLNLLILIILDSAPTVVSSTSQTDTVDVEILTDIVHGIPPHLRVCGVLRRLSGIIKA